MRKGVADRSSRRARRKRPRCRNEIAPAIIVLSAIIAEATPLAAAEFRGSKPYLRTTPPAVFPSSDGSDSGFPILGFQLSPATSQLACGVELPTRCLLLASHEKAPLEDFPSLERKANMRHGAEAQIGAFPDFVSDIP